MNLKAEQMSCFHYDLLAREVPIERVIWMLRIRIKSLVSQSKDLQKWINHIKRRNLHNLICGDYEVAPMLRAEFDRVYAAKLQVEGDLRATQLAYALVRGKRYADIERKVENKRFVTGALRHRIARILCDSAGMDYFRDSNVVGILSDLLLWLEGKPFRKVL